MYSNIMNFSVFSGLVAFSFAATADGPAAPQLGNMISSEEIRFISTTVFPDGQGLPEGRGSVQEGRVVYAEQCGFCHGENLEGNGGMIPKLAGKPEYGADWSTGYSWPYATSIFDYTRRAMPPFAPKELSADELYAVTAYLLFMNGIIESDASLDQSSLPEVRMPARDYANSKWEKIEKHSFSND